MPYASTTGTTYHDSRTCRRLHATGGRIRQTDAGERDACPHCVDDPEGEPASVGYLLEDGRCPWCDEYDGEHVKQHASSAHPDAWTDWKNSDD